MAYGACNRMKVGFTTTCTISGYHHLSCEYESRPRQGVLDTTSFSFVLVYLCIYTMLGFYILIVHAMERFFGIGVVYASTRFTQKGRRGCDSLSWIYSYL
jgi:hypothetical protein